MSALEALRLLKAGPPLLSLGTKYCVLQSLPVCSAPIRGAFFPVLSPHQPVSSSSSSQSRGRMWREDFPELSARVRPLEHFVCSWLLSHQNTCQRTRREARAGHTVVSLGEVLRPSRHFTHTACRPRSPSLLLDLTHAVALGWDDKK